VPKDYFMPKLAMAMNEGTINEWLIEDGHQIENGEPLVVVETEKVAYDLESPESGLVRILVAAGETVPVESRIAIFADSADELATMQESAPPRVDSSGAVDAQEYFDAEPTSSDSARIKASPLARKLAQQNQLDLATVKGSGPAGRIVKRDIVSALDRKIRMTSVLKMSE